MTAWYNLYIPDPKPMEFKQNISFGFNGLQINTELCY